MKILALDTACATASCAISENGQLLAEAAIHGTRTHSQKLLPMVVGLLASIDLTPSDIDCFAAAKGPGSFTGLRIGIVTAKGLAFATGKPLVGIPTLEALAFTVPAWPGVICPVVDARNKQAFCGFYARHMDQAQPLTCLAEDIVLHVDALADTLAAFGKDVLLIGDCAARFLPLIRNRWALQECPQKIVGADPFLFTTRAAATALLTGLRHPDGVSAESGQSGDPFRLEPDYLRASQAEQRRYDVAP